MEKIFKKIWDDLPRQYMPAMDHVIREDFENALRKAKSRIGVIHRLFDEYATNRPEEMDMERTVLELALKYASENADPEELARVYSKLGGIYLHTFMEPLGNGRFDKAVEYLDKSIKIFPLPTAYFKSARVLRILKGNGARLEGKDINELIEEQYLKSIDLFKKEGTSLGVFDISVELNMFYQSLFRDTSNNDFLIKAKTLLENIPIPEHTVIPTDIEAQRSILLASLDIGLSNQPSYANHKKHLISIYQSLKDICQDLTTKATMFQLCETMVGLLLSEKMNDEASSWFNIMKNYIIGKEDEQTCLKYECFFADQTKNEKMNSIKILEKRIFHLLEQFPQTHSASHQSNIYAEIEGITNSLVLMLIDENQIEKAFLASENYLNHHFRSNYIYHSIKPRSTQGRIVNAQLGVLGNAKKSIENILIPANMGNEDFLESIEEMSFLSPRILSGLNHEEVDQITKFDIQIQHEVKECSKTKDSFRELHGKMLNSIEGTRNQLFTIEPELRNIFYFLTNKDLETICQRNSNRVFLQLFLLGNQLISIGIGFSTHHNSYFCDAFRSQPVLTEERSQNFNDSLRAETPPFASDTSEYTVMLGEAFNEVTEKWLERGFKAFSILPKGFGPRAFPWHSLINKNGDRFIHLIERVSYSPSILTYHLPKEIQPKGKTGIMVGRDKGEDDRLIWGSLFLEKVASHHHNISIMEPTSRETLIQSFLGNQGYTSYCFYCHATRDKNTGNYLILDKGEPRNDRDYFHLPDLQYKETYGPAMMPSVPWSTIRNVGLWACQTADVSVPLHHHNPKDEAFSLIEDFMGRGVHSVITSFYPVIDFPTALIAAYYYQLLINEELDEEKAFTRTLQWYFSEGKKRLVSFCEEAVKQESKERPDYYVINKCITNIFGYPKSVPTTEKWGNLLRPGSRTAKEKDEGSYFSVKDFQKMLNDPRSVMTLTLWKGGVVNGE